MPLEQCLSSTEEWTPSRLWSELDAASKREASEALYGGARSDPASRREADRAIAAALRFRENAVRQLSAQRRVDYLTRAVRPDDSLAGSLLIALHLERRTEILEALLGGLDVPNQDGLIDEEHDFESPGADRLAPVIDTLYERFPSDRVDLYLATLLALDPESWGALRGVLRERRTA